MVLSVSIDLLELMESIVKISSIALLGFIFTISNSIIVAKR